MDLRNWHRNCSAVALAAAFVAVSCAPEIDLSKTVPGPPGTDESISAALWVYGYGNHVPQPSVYWYGPKAFDCTGFAYGQQLPGFTVDGECMNGMTEGMEPRRLVVVYPPDGYISHSSLAHELAHFVFGGHDHPAWIFGPDQSDEGIVGVAMRAIGNIGY
jgi:hypothetical protein